MRILHPNPLLVLKDSTVLKAIQRVQFVLRGTNVLTAHRQQCVLGDNLHLFDPQPVRHVLQAIGVLAKECLPQRAVPMDSTPTRPYRKDVISVKQVGSVQMAIDPCHVRLATLVNTDSLTARLASQEITAQQDHRTVFHVQQGNSVLVLHLSQ